MSATRSARLEGVNNYSPALKAWIAEVLAGVDKGAGSVRILRIAPSGSVDHSSRISFDVTGWYCFH